MTNDLIVPIMLTINETVKQFNLPEYFVRQCVKNGDVVSIFAGRKILINAESLSRYLTTGIPQGQAPKEETKKEALSGGRFTPIPVKREGGVCK